MSSRLFEITGKVAVVTGAASGIGAAILAGFHSAGARVVAVDLVEPAEMQPGIDAYEVCDVRDSDQVERVAQKVLAQFGRVDILVNTAAIARGGMAKEMSQKDWDDVMEINARGTFLCCQTFGRAMISQRYGKIVNFASRCGYIGYPEYISYNASKAAVISITKTLAVEWAPYHVTVNALAPGFVRTPMTRYVWSDSTRLDSIVSRIPIGRMAEPEEVAGAVLFFAAPASDYVTGTVLPFDGGMLVY